LSFHFDPSGECSPYSIDDLFLASKN
jgi:hypothetical protein